MTVDASPMDFKDEPIRILIVDDSSLVQSITSIHLKELGCVVDTAYDGYTALAQCNCVCYDAILMDLGLYPGINGFDSAKKIKEQSKLNRNTLIIAFSSHSEAQSYQQMRQSGITGFIAKPFSQLEAKELMHFLSQQKK